MTGGYRKEGVTYLISIKDSLRNTFKGLYHDNANVSVFADNSNNTDLKIRNKLVQPPEVSYFRVLGVWGKLDRN